MQSRKKQLHSNAVFTATTYDGLGTVTSYACMLTRQNSIVIGNWTSRQLNTPNGAFQFRALFGSLSMNIIVYRGPFRGSLCMEPKDAGACSRRPSHVAGPPGAGRRATPAPRYLGSPSMSSRLGLATWRRLWAYVAVYDLFLFGIIIIRILPKKELHRSLQVLR